MEIYLIRHPKTVAPKGLCYGQTDFEIEGDLFVAQQTIIEKLPHFETSPKIYSSPLQRCLQIANIFSQSVTVDTQLMELNFGDWENKFFDALPCEDVKDWSANFVEIPPPNGENFLQLMQRVGKFWQILISENVEVVLIFTHAGVIRALLAILLKCPPQNVFHFQIECNSVQKFRHENDYTFIEYLNR